MTFYINFSIRIYDRKLLFNKQQFMHASEVGGGENPFRSARTTKNQECFNSKVEVEGISFPGAISHKLFLSFSFCHTDTRIPNSNFHI